MMSFRVSEVESFRQWLVDPDADLDALIARMRGLSEPSEAMLAGTAFHKALELATEQEHEQLQALGYTFHIAANIELALPKIREIRAGKIYETDHGPVTITGQLDIIEGKRIEDHKTTGRFDPERYLDGYQWRLYLDIFEADRFRWNVFEIACNEDAYPPGMVWDVSAMHTLEQFRYPGMGADCQELVNQLAGFAVRQLPERIAPDSYAPAPTPAPVQIASPAPVSQAAAASPGVVQMAPRASAGAATLKLGEINARIAPLSIDAAGLARLGFSPAATDKSAKLYREADFGPMVDSIVAHLRTVQQQRQAA